jgi:hypothetical protein
MGKLIKAMVPKTLLLNVVNNINYNKIIIDYYKKYAEELGEPKKKTLENKVENIELCNKFWDIDVYHKSLVKDYKKTTLCKDKFCNNCKKVKQAARMAKYMPKLEKYKDYAYHLTLTSPTVPGEELKNKIKLMSKCYRELNRILNGTKVIKGLDFSSWGYIGSIRSLEVTYLDNIYHPHYHCFLVLEDLKMGLKDKTNNYSYSYYKFHQGFSNEEVLIQKIWYLLINEIRVTKNNIDKLDIGYSCKMDKLQEGAYNELFKYMTKEVNDSGNVLTYENFKTLYEALYRVKQIQGYGCLYQVTDEGDTESMIKEYQKLIDELQKIENPENVLERPQDLLLDKKYTLISRKSYMKYLKDL